MVTKNTFVATDGSTFVFDHRQLRAARAYLGWTQAEFGKVAGISARSINEIEHGRRIIREGTVRKLQHAFTRAGITLNSDGSGISGPIGSDPTPLPDRNQ